MSETMGRRAAILGFLSVSTLLTTGMAGCDGVENQRVNGTMVKPSDVIERRDELRAKKQKEEEDAKKAKAKKKT
jgi:hypothetical protein